MPVFTSGGEQWICQAQADYENCVCASATDDQDVSKEDDLWTVAGIYNGSSTLDNVSDCNFFTIAGYYLCVHIIVFALSVVLMSSMFKMSQFAPDRDLINLEIIVFLFVPPTIRQALHAVHQESKALFNLFYKNYLVIVVVQVIYTVQYLFSLFFNFYYFTYSLPAKFTDKDEAWFYFHCIVVGMQVKSGFARAAAGVQ